MKKLFLSIVACATMLTVSLNAMAESGTSTENMAGQGAPFKENGYSYEFTTSGSSVTIKFTLLDEYDGLNNAYLWDYTNGFAELSMQYNIATKTASITLTNQKGGSTITFACKIAYAGGMSVTKRFSYTVEGDGGGEEGEEEKPTGAYCQGSDTESSDLINGKPFENGYDYLIQTIDNGGGNYSVAVTVTFKDVREGIVAFLIENGTKETQIGQTKVVNYTFTDLADLDEIKFCVKFAFAGGFSMTKTFDYFVGTMCDGNRPQIDDEDEDEEEENPTSLKPIHQFTGSPIKLIKDGHLYIIRNNARYTAAGEPLNW